MKKSCLADGLDIHFLLNPVGALLGYALLLKRVDQPETLRGGNEKFSLGFGGIKGLNEGRFAKQEIHVRNTIKPVLEQAISINGKIGRYHRHARAVTKMRLQKITHAAAVVVIADARWLRNIWL